MILPSDRVMFAICGVTGLILNKLAHDVATILPLNIFNRNCHIPNRFQMPACRIKVIFADFAQNWLPGKVPWRIGKIGLDWSSMNKYLSCGEKNCENRSSGSWDNLSPRNHKKERKKEINASKIYSPFGKFAKRAKVWSTLLLTQITAVCIA